MSLVFKLQKNNGGFYCQIWKLVSNYLYSKKHNLKFYVDDTEWMFKHNLGWRDYFSSLSLLSENSIEHPIQYELNVEDKRLHKFTLNEYMNAFKEVYILNNDMIELYNKKKLLLPENYNAIMIRRGDKMYGESNYIETSSYVNKLLDKNNADIFVQTDDYSAFEEVRNLVNLHHNNKVLTFCPPEKRGAFVFNFAPTVGSKVSDLNNKYILDLSAIHQKSVNQYSSNEMKDHVEEMIIGLQLCMNSNYLVTDLQSNVTRFLFCTHSVPSNVITIGNITPPSLNVWVECPAKGFAPYR